MEENKELFCKRYNEGKLDWTLIDFNTLIPVVKVFTFGEKKYGKFNWKKDLKEKNEPLKSAFRHMIAINNGEHYDSESGELHAAHVICNMMMLIYHNKNNKNEII